SFGGLLTATNAAVSLTGAEYTVGGTLSGLLGISATGASASLGSALALSVSDGGDADASALTGGYNLATDQFELTLDTVGLALGTLATLNMTGAAARFDPNASGASKLIIGAQGVTGNVVGAGDINAGSFILVFYGDGKYAFEGRAVASIGIPGAATVSGQVSIVSNTALAAALGETIAVNGQALTVSVTANGDSVAASGLQIGLADSVFLTGDFTYASNDEVFSGQTLRRVTVANGRLEMSPGSVKLVAANISGLLLIGNGGVAAGRLTVGSLGLSGVSGVTLSASNVVLEANTTGAAISGTLGAETLDFTSAERLNFKSISATATLGLAAGGFASSLNGTFSFGLATVLVNGASTQILSVGVSGGSMALGVGGATLNA
ncbi:MAG: hypothetical protein EBS01_16185, partial [Verrucomicrobia bacterium]|nr:hypothetical protein [Verrucomicrobiota bacterium]